MNYGRSGHFSVATVIGGEGFMQVSIDFIRAGRCRENKMGRRLDWVVCMIFAENFPQSRRGRSQDAQRIDQRCDQVEVLRRRFSMRFTDILCRDFEIARWSVGIGRRRAVVRVFNGCDGVEFHAHSELEGLITHSEDWRRLRSSTSHAAEK